MKLLKLFIALVFLCCLELGQVWALNSNNNNNDLVISLSVPTKKTAYGANDALVIDFEIKNNNDKDIKVLKWHTPFEQNWTADSFNIYVGGKKVIYIGRMVKRAPPQASDYMLIKSGESVRTSVNLEEGYDFSTKGHYKIHYKTYYLNYKFLNGQGNQLQGNQLQKQKQPIETNELLFDLSENRIDKNLKKKLFQSINAKQTPSFYSCSDSQKITVNSALDAAEIIALTAKNALNHTAVSQRNESIRYQTWFGSYVSSRYDTAINNFNKIYDALVNKPIGIDCGCTGNYYAHVYSNSPYKIYLCNAFWSAPLNGTDSKAGVMIHELSHFTVIAGTTDNVYGQYGAKNLANNDPSAALENADNHEYFAENTPYLSIPVANDDHGDSRELATVIDKNSTTTGNIESDNDVDYFKIILIGAGSLTITVTSALNMRGKLENSLGNQLDDNSGTNFAIGGNLISGTYYIKMNTYDGNIGNYNLVISFDTSEYTLGVSAINGNVTSSPIGINCGSDCLKFFIKNASITLTATANTGYAFNSWSGDCSGNANPTTLTMNSDKSCSTNFAIDTDNDGIPNVTDTDDDNDGIPDTWEIANNLNPLDSSDANRDSDGDGSINLDEWTNNTNPQIDDIIPILLQGFKPVLNAQGRKTAFGLSLFGVSAADIKDGSITPKIILINNKNPIIRVGKLILKSGRHTLTWQATDSAGNIATITQTVDILPRVNFEINQTVAEGMSPMVNVHLTGLAPSYPVEIPFSLSGTAQSSDYSLTENKMIINSGKKGTMTIAVSTDSDTEENETIILTMNALSGLVQGQKNKHIIRILATNSNKPPKIQKITVKQGSDIRGRLVSQAKGAVIVTADVLGFNGTPLTYLWNGGALANLNANNATNFSFDPSANNLGLFELKLKVNDSTSSTDYQIPIKIIETDVVHSNTADTDGDGVLDKNEPYDVDGNGIPDYKEVEHASSELQIDANKGVRSPVGTRIKMHIMAQDSAKLTEDRIKTYRTENGLSAYVNDDTYNPKEMFAFVVDNFENAGDSISIIINLSSPAIEGTILRKYSLDEGWKDFVVNAKNYIEYNTRGDGLCLDSDTWTKSSNNVIQTGVTCLKTTIEDGGPNDADNLVNGSIDDPVATSTPQVTIIQTSSSSSSSSGGGGGGVISWWSLLALFLMVFATSGFANKSQKYIV